MIKILWILLRNFLKLITVDAKDEWFKGLVLVCVGAFVVLIITLCTISPGFKATFTAVMFFFAVMIILCILGASIHSAKESISAGYKIAKEEAEKDKTKEMKLGDLQIAEVPSRAPGTTMAQINGKWVPARPENFKPVCCPLWKRIGYAWQVVLGRSETFVWPEGQ